MVSQPVRPDEPLLVETPLLTIPVGRYNWGTYGWDFVDALLGDRALLQRYDRCKLAATEFLLDQEDLDTLTALMRKHKLSRERVRRLYFDVCTNNIGVLADDQRRVVRYGLFERMSRSDHSCAPSSRLVSSASDRSAMALVAGRDLKPGEAVTWSYFQEDDFLQADFETRNLALVNTFRFVCRCERCRAERPPELAGKRDLLPYFDAQLRKMAEEMAKTPEGRAEILASTPMEMHRRALTGR